MIYYYCADLYINLQDTLCEQTAIITGQLVLNPLLLIFMYARKLFHTVYYFCWKFFTFYFLAIILCLHFPRYYIQTIIWCIVYVITMLIMSNNGCNTIATVLPFYMQKTQHDCAHFTFLPTKNATRLRSVKYMSCHYKKYMFLPNTLFKNTVEVVNSKLG